MSFEAPVPDNSVSIAGGRASIYAIPDITPLVTLAFSTSLDPGPTDIVQMRMANGPPLPDPDAEGTEMTPGAWRPWQEFVPQASWWLTQGEGYKTVYVQYRILEADGDIRGLTEIASDTVNLSYWWPVGYLEPAFQVRRIHYGAVQGGDYVRGSDWMLGTLVGLTTPLPTEPEPLIGDTWAVGEPTPTVIPAYEPPDAAPVPAQLGHAIRWDGSDWINLGPLPDIVHTALRYPSGVTADSAVVQALLGKAILHTRPKSHFDLEIPLKFPNGTYAGERIAPMGTIEVRWEWPVSISAAWSEVALVRSAFGRPTTPNDGATIYRKPQTAFLTFPDEPLANPEPLEDGPLASGRWYYYTLFFKVDPITWVAAMSDSCLLPRDFNHDDHLWEGVPPYYQWTDDNIREGNGYLRQFLNVFAFELDHTREFVESWQQLYRTDFSPMKLLRHLGANIGLPYTQTAAGVGEINYRSLLSEIGFLYDVRGTRGCLERVIEAMSKYQCDVTNGLNLMLLNDDSDFFTGTGNWAVIHPDTDTSIIDEVLDEVILPGNVDFSVDPRMAPPPKSGRRVMRVAVQPSATDDDLLITVGDGIVPYKGQFAPQREVIPLMAGVPAKAHWIYGFSVKLYTRDAGLITTIGMIFFDKDGQPTDIIDAGAWPPPLALDTEEWVEKNIQGEAPENTVYVVPVIRMYPVTTTSDFWVAGAMVYILGEAGAVATVTPDRYLTLGDPAELIGEERTTPPYEPYVLGESLS